MRLLFTCVPGFGHFHPLLPLARAAKAAGHEVAFATSPRFAETVERAGFEHLPAGLDWDERQLLETIAELRAVAPIYRGEWMMRHLFLDRVPRAMVPDLMAIIASWRPNLIVAGAFDYGGALAAEKAGLPYARGSYIARWHPWILKFAIGRAMAKLRASFDLPPDPDLRAFHDHLDFCFAPPSWTFEGGLLRPGLARLVRARMASGEIPWRQRFWGLRALLFQKLFARAVRSHPEQSALGPNTVFVAEGTSCEAVAPPPAWLQEMPRQPTVFVSLGTVLSGQYPDVFDKIVAGLRDQPINLIMTLGGNDDPARFGAQPPNVRIVRFIAQEELRAMLPHVDLCVNHAGYSSVTEALLHGIPLVLLPLTADAPMNTQMCQSIGVTPSLPAEVWGLSPKGMPVIRPDRLTPQIIRDAVLHGLQDPACREAARRTQQELAGRRPLEDAVRMLEVLVTAP